MTKPTSMLTDFVAMPSRALGDRNLTALHLVVLGAVCRAVEPKTAQAIITHERIAEITNRPRQKVVGAVADLAALGYVTPINRGRQAHSSTPGRFLTNAYLIHYDGEVVDGTALPSRTNKRPPPVRRVTPPVTRETSPKTVAPCHPPGDTAHVTPPVHSHVTPPVADPDLYLPDHFIAPDLQAAAAPRADASHEGQQDPVDHFREMFAGTGSRRRCADDGDGLHDPQELAERNHEANREILIGALQKRLGKSRREAKAMLEQLTPDRIDAIAEKARADRLTDDALQSSLADAEPQIWTDAKGRVRDYPPPEGWDPEWHGEWTGQRETPPACPLPEHARWLTSVSRNELPSAAALIESWVDFVGIDETRALLEAAQIAGMKDEALGRHVAKGIAAALDRRDQDG